MKCLTAFLVLGLVTGLLGCSEQRPAAESRPGPVEAVSAPVDPEIKAQAAAANAFAADLYAHLQKGEGNLAFSPVSIASALKMTAAGARGETAAQMAKVLHSNAPGDQTHAAAGKLARHLSLPNPNARFLMANALWGQAHHPFRSEFVALLKEDYDAGLREVDFVRDSTAARQTINRWVEAQTQDKIRDLLQSGDVTGQTRLVLTNAVYFKADWQEPFPAARTQTGDFHRTATDAVRVPLMQHELMTPYFRDDDVQVLELPYAGGKFAMVVILPRQRGGLADIELQLNERQPAQWIERLRPASVNVVLPRFQIAARHQLAEILAAMGMPLAFSAAGDFSGMDGKHHLRINQAIHQAHIDVDERGTEAAAATAVVVGDSLRPAFRADHPFVFLIRDRVSGAILFIGRVLDPKAR